MRAFAHHLEGVEMISPSLNEPFRHHRHRYSPYHFIIINNTLFMRDPRRMLNLYGHDRRLMMGINSVAAV